MYSTINYFKFYMLILYVISVELRGLVITNTMSMLKCAGYI